MRHRIIVHIGTHKTGTTSIQRSLADGRDRLGAAGVLYATSERGAKPHPSKHLWTSRIARSGDLAAAENERRELLDEFARSGCHTMILSEEGLSAPSEHTAAFFKPLLEHHDVDVVCYLRRQDIFVEALYNQFTREAARRNDLSISAFWQSSRILEWTDYHTLLSRWRGASSRVIAVDFDKEIAGGELVASFARTCGLGDVTLHEWSSNPSPDNRLALVIEHMNRMGIEYDVRSLIRAAARKRVTNLFTKLKYILGGIERARLLERVAASNEQLAAEFGVRFSPKMPPGEQAEPAQLELEYALALLSAAARPKAHGRNSRESASAETIEA